MRSQNNAENDILCALMGKNVHFQWIIRMSDRINISFSLVVHFVNCFFVVCPFHSSISSSSSFTHPPFGYRISANDYPTALSVNVNDCLKPLSLGKKKTHEEASAAHNGHTIQPAQWTIQTSIKSQITNVRCQCDSQCRR